MRGRESEREEMDYATVDTLKNETFALALQATCQHHSIKNLIYSISLPSTRSLIGTRNLPL